MLHARSAPGSPVCRGFCCGTLRKHADVDYDRHLERIADAVREMGGAKLIVARCLDICARFNVVVVRSRAASRRETLWFGEVLSNKRLEALCTWLRTGGLRAPLPATLASVRFLRRSRRRDV